MSESKSHPLGNDKIYLGGHHRTVEQLKRMQDIAKRDICFMCPEHITEFYQKDGNLIKEGRYVYLVKNTYPYENTQHHLMAIPKAHITRLADLPAPTWAEILELFKDQERKLKVKGAAVALRFGDPALTGATVHHLHMHFIVPKPNIRPGEKPVKFRMSRKSA